MKGRSWLNDAQAVTLAKLGGDYLIHDRNTKYCAAFLRILQDAGANDVPLPTRSPNLNPHAERWVRSIKDDCLHDMILFGERSVEHTVAEYVRHYHAERAGSSGRVHTRTRRWGFSKAIRL